MTGATPTLVFAGGGSGGHVFPALAIAEAARALRPEIGIHVLCSDRAIDRSILEAAGVAFTPVPARPLAARPRAIAALLTSWGAAKGVARRVLDDALRRGPVHMVSTGGFVSVPCAAAARARGVGVSLVNLDRVPGRANRYVARRADRVFTAARVDAVRSRNWIEVNPIVRAAVRAHGTDPDAIRSRLGLAAGARVLAVLGGSQGATSVNRLLAHVAVHHPDWLAGWAVLHQCGATSGGGDSGVAELEQAYRDAGVAAIVRPFFGDDGDDGNTSSPRSTPTMGEVWSIADLAVCRSGAGTVSEVRAARVPAVFVPYPYHRDQHQRVNAEPIADIGGGVILEDRIEPGSTLDLASGGGGALLREVLKDHGRCDSMRRALATLPACDGAERIARDIIAVLEHT